MTKEIEQSDVIGDTPPDNIELPAVVQISQNPATNQKKAYAYLMRFWEKNPWFQKKLDSEDDPHVLVEADSTGTRASIITKEQAAAVAKVLAALGITGFLIWRYIDFKNEQKKD